MPRQIAALSALILSVLLLVSGNAFLTTLLGVRLGIEGVTSAVIGWILAGYSLGFVLGTLHVGKVIARVGHIRSFAAFAALAAVVCLLHPIWSWLWGWALLRAVTGFAMAGLLVVIESWFSSRATSENRGRLFAVYQICFYMAAASGQLLVNIGNPVNFMPFSVAAILLSLALIPLALTKMEAPVIEVAERMTLRELWLASPLGVGGAVAGGVAIGGFYAMGPVYATLSGLSIQQISVFMAIPIIAAVLFAWPLGRICDRFERREVMLILAAVSALACVAVALWGVISPLLVIALSGVFMGTCAALYPVAVAVTNDRMHAHRVVAASSGLLLSYGLGSCVGPPLASALMTWLGPSGLFTTNALVLVVLCLAGLYRVRHSPPIPVAEQEHFVPALPESTPVITELDPRNEDFVAADAAEVPP